MITNELEPDVAVVGGGIGGLAAGIFLARQGRRVILFERSNSPGGRARTHNEDGFFMNLGPHALYRGGAGMKILNELGIQPSGNTPKASGQFAIKGGVKHTFPSGVVSMLATGLFDLSAKLEAARLLGSVAKVVGADLMDVSVQEWLDDTISHADVKNFIQAVFRLATYTNAPDRMSAGVTLEQLKMAITSNVLYIDQGWQTLVDALVQESERAGVTIMTGARVESIERTGEGAVMAVHLNDGRSYHVPVAVIASNPDTAAELVENADRSSLKQFADESIPVKAACLDVALDRLPHPNTSFALGIDSSVYYSVHSTSARLAPEGAALIQLGKYLPPGYAEPPSVAEREMEELLTLVQPGWREVLAHRRYLPELVVYNAIPLASRGGFKGRPSPEVRDVPGLFLVGDWIGPEGLLADATLASAKLAAGLAARYQAESVALSV
jgi:phytoene dehydrogenase-like protein